MDDNIIRALLEAGGVGGTILGVAWIMRAVLLKWLDNLAAARKFEAEREQGELEQSRRLETALNGVVGELALSRQVNSQFAARMEQLPTRLDFDQVSVTMRDWANKHDADMNDIPKKVWELSEEPLAELKQQLIEAMKVCLSEQVDLATIQAQLSELLTQLNQVIEKKEETNKPEEA